MKFFNANTQTVVNISGIKRGEVEGTFVSAEAGGREEGPKFVAKWADVIIEKRDDSGKQYFVCDPEWVALGRVAKDSDNDKQPKQPKKNKKNNNASASASASDSASDNASDNASASASASGLSTEEVALILALKRMKGGSIDRDEVKKICHEVFDEIYKSLAENKPKEYADFVRKAKKQGKKEVYCDNFKKIVRNTRKGFYCYLEGPAGSGKSHTAEQVAEELGLDFYGQTTIQFAHDVRGYGDAGGNFQDTPFFKAFAFGGLYFQDEYDRSNAEAAIVLNSALSNGWYDFPIIGKVEMHPKFRFMAAGNTLLDGNSSQYNTGQQLDASSKDRFKTFFHIDYNHRVEMYIANGDETLVSFVEDVRSAIKACGLEHVVSYRATEYMADPDVRKEDTKQEILLDCTFKGLDKDAIHEIYSSLSNKANIWAVAMSKI